MHVLPFCNICRLKVYSLKHFPFLIGKKKKSHFYLILNQISWLSLISYKRYAINFIFNYFCLQKAITAPKITLLRILILEVCQYVCVCSCKQLFFSVFLCLKVKHWLRIPLSKFVLSVFPPPASLSVSVCMGSVL